MISGILKKKSKLPVEKVKLNLSKTNILINSLSSKFVENEYICLVNGRFDDYKNLLKKLSITSNTSITSAQLVLSAFLKWGYNCVHHLIGDWSIAIWNNRKNELFIARDHIGHANLYYFNSKDNFIFSSNLKQLLKNRLISKTLNPNAILQEYSSFARDNQTFYEGIFGLTPGHFLVVSPTTFRIENYWIPERKRTIRYKNDNEYVEHFLELFEVAIKDRVTNEKKGLLLSSGLDSTSILALLSPLLTKRGSGITTLTWSTNLKENLLYLPSKNYYNNEVDLAKEFALKFSNVNFSIAFSKSKNIISTISRWIDVYSQPEINNIMVSELFEKAQNLGIKSIFTGYGGNFNISYPGNRNQYFKELIKKRKWKKYLKSISEWQQQNTSWLKMLSLSIYAPFFTDNRNNIKSKTRENILNQEAISTYEKRFKLYLNNFTSIKKNSQDPIIKGYMRDMKAETMGNSNRYAQSYGIECVTPTMDKRIIEFCLSIPNEQFIGKGQQKWLLKRAMKNRVNDNILYNQRRGLQGGDIIHKFKTEMKSIIALLEELKKSPLVSFWLNTKQLEKYLQIIDSGSYTRIEYYSARMLIRGLTLGLFLLKFEGDYEIKAI